MKSIFLIIVSLCSNYLMAQEVITPPDVVKLAFEKGYPNKKPVWSMEYVGDDNDEIRYEAKFNLTTKTKAVAVYDNSGILKAFEKKIPLSELPQKAQTYLKTNYPTNAIREIAIITDYKNKITYEVGIKKEDKFYDVVFDKNGGFDVIIQKD